MGQATSSSRPAQTSVGETPAIFLLMAPLAEPRQKADEEASCYPRQPPRAGSRAGRAERADVRSLCGPAHHPSILWSTFRFLSPKVHFPLGGPVKMALSLAHALEPAHSGCESPGGTSHLRPRLNSETSRW